MKIPVFHTKNELFKFLKENKADLIASKKYSIKHADSVFHNVPLENSRGEAIKVAKVLDKSVDTLSAKVVINTTNLLDSHGDVHIPGLWSKSIKESKNVYFLQEHKMQFDSIIADKVKASAVNYTWAELGFPEYKGSTQALVFDANISADRNLFMFEQYSKGYVSNHSVGMQYVNMFLCLNSEDKYFKEEKANWDKYISEVANKEGAIRAGNFWAVTEAKIIEGSAVVRGSNFATPTLSIDTQTDAGKSTSENNEPAQTTQTEKLKYLTTNLKLK